MTDLRKAAEDLLEGVEAAIKAGDWKVDGACDPDSAIIRLRQALAQPVAAVNTSQERVDETAKREHEPIAFVTGYFGGHLTISCFDTALVLPDGLALYTAPPKREWVGLTDDECVAAISDLFDAALMDGNVPNEIVIGYARAIEAKLKEKNT